MCRQVLAVGIGPTALQFLQDPQSCISGKIVEGLLAFWLPLKIGMSVRAALTTLLTLRGQRGAEDPGCPSAASGANLKCCNHQF
jgi:hypothetical protein